MPRQRLGQLLFACYLIALTIASLVPGSDLPSVSYNDKVAHLGAYFVLGVLAMSFGRRPAFFGLLFLYGLGIEVLQGMSGQRELSLLDALANGCGLLLAWLAANHYWRRTANLLYSKR